MHRLRSSMATAAAVRTLKTVAPHIPSIKFPPRSNAPMKWTASSQMKVPSSSPRGSGIDDKDLPLRFKRRPISEEEMEFIEKGGPL